MSKKVFILFVFLLFIDGGYIFVSGQNEETGKYLAREHVTKISSMLEMDSFLDKHPISLVLFFASWCGFCHVVLSELAQVSMIRDGSPGKIGDQSPSSTGIASVRCDKNAEVCESYHIDSYPTLISFLNGKPVREIFGYEHSKIVEYIKRLSSPLLPELRGEVAISSFQSRTMSVLGCFPETADRNIFASIAEKFRDIFYFGLLSKDISASICPIPSIRITDASGFREVVDWRLAKHNFTSLLLSRSLPLVNHYSPLDNALLHRYSSDLPLCVFFYLLAEDRDILEERINMISPRYRHKAIFILANWLEAEPLAREFKIDDPVSCALPTLSIGYVEKEVFYLFPGCGIDTLVPEAMSRFLDGVLEHKIEPFGRSEERLYTNGIDENEEDELVDSKTMINRITHDTFKKHVLNISRYMPVLVQLYADWCLECKAFEPIFESVARSLEGKAKLVTFNVDSNDIPNISGIGQYRRLPQLYFYPQIPTTHARCSEYRNCTIFNPIKYDGALDSSSIIDFVTTSMATLPNMDIEHDEL